MLPLHHDHHEKSLLATTTHARAARTLEPENGTEARDERGRPDSNRRRLGGQPSALAVLSYVPQVRRGEERGWDSNPRSRAHEAREDSLSSTAQSARLESNQRSPVPETGGVAVSPTGRQEPGAMWPAGIEPAARRVSGDRSTAELRPRANGRTAYEKRRFSATIRAYDASSDERERTPVCAARSSAAYASSPTASPPLPSTPATKTRSIPALTA
jgi:hypothetical protein